MIHHRYGRLRGLPQQKWARNNHLTSLSPETPVIASKAQKLPIPQVGGCIAGVRWALEDALSTLSPPCAESAESAAYLGSACKVPFKPTRFVPCAPHNIPTTLTCLQLWILLNLSTRGAAVWGQASINGGPYAYSLRTVCLRPILYAAWPFF